MKFPLSSSISTRGTSEYPSRARQKGGLTSRGDSEKTGESGTKSSQRASEQFEKVQRRTMGLPCCPNCELGRGRPVRRRGGRETGARRTHVRSSSHLCVERKISLSSTFFYSPPSLSSPSCEFRTDSWSRCWACPSSCRTRSHRAKELALGSFEVHLEKERGKERQSSRKEERLNGEKGRTIVLDLLLSFVAVVRRVGDG